MGSCCSAQRGSTILADGGSTKISAKKLRQEIIDWKLPGYPSLIQRKWQFVNNAQDGCSITVLSFNVLADSKQGEEEWTTTPAVFDWDLRKWRLLEEVIANGLADIVSIQECDHFDTFWLPSMRSLGYEGQLHREPQPAADGVAVFWLPTRLTKQQEYPVTFAGLSDDPKLINKGVALVYRMKLSTSPQEFILANVHLMPGKTEKDEAGRECQAIKTLDVAAAAGGGLPTLVMGDYNAQPDKDDKIGKPCAYSATINHAGIDLTSTYADALGGEPEYTTWKRRPPPKGEVKRTIDYMFHTKEFKTTQILKLPLREDMDEELTPSFMYGSDHFALAAAYVLC